MYTLIFTAVVVIYNVGPRIVHLEHDYPTEQSCQAAYKIVKTQIGPSTDSYISSVNGTCLYVGEKK